MLALIDSDTPVFATAIASEDVSESIAKSRLDLTIRNIVKGSECTDYKLFVSGGNNFRYDIDPTYKANRTGSDPKWREALRLHLIKEWDAYECVGFEADDMCGVEQKEDGSTMIVAIDKDLLQVPGLHYQWAIIRKGVVVRPAQFLEVAPLQGLQSFFKQMLTGDVCDNIKGVKGIGAKKAEALITPLKTEEEMYDAVLDLYHRDDTDKESIVCSEERFKRNCDLLWIFRNLGETYSVRREIRG